jgi:signal transduction histidine kinase/ligand-binding sensor domain-containing protein
LGFAQPPQYKHLTVKNGLPSKTVYKAFQDKKGFIWFASDAGVARYDGVVFENFTMDDGLSDNEVLQIKEDSKGRIWFLTFNGQLSYFYNEKIHNQENDYSLKNFIQNGFICSMLEDTEHNLWFGRSSKLITKLSPSGLMTNYELPNTGLRQALEPCFFEHNGMNCITSDGLFKIEHQKVIITQKFSIEKMAHFVPYSYATNKIYYPTHEGIYSLINGQKQCLIKDTSLINFKRIISLIVAKNEDLWVTTDNGQTSLFKKNGANYAFAGHYLDSLQVIYVFTDREENVWFCTRGNGVFFKSARNINSLVYNLQSGLHTNEIISLHADKFQGIWMGFADGNVQYFKDNQFRTFDCNFFNRATNRILDITGDSVGNILLAADEGIVFIKKNFGKYGAPKFIRLQDNQDFGKPYYAKRIGITANNSIYFNSAVCRGFLFKEGEGYIAKVDTVNFERDRIFTSYIDKQGTQWISTIKGLISIKNKGIKNFGEQVNWLKQRLVKIAELSDGNLVLCTAGKGLALFNRNKIIRIISVKDKLGSNTINDVVVVDDNVYVATNKGVSCFIYQQGTLIFKFNYDSNEGLLSNKVNAIVIKDSILYAATSEGLSIVTIKDYQFKKPNLQTSIKFFNVNGENMLQANALNIDYKKSHLQVHFKAPVFSHPELLSYQYQLKGKSQNWVSTTNDFVEFYGLPPGKYTFKVRAKYNNIIDQNPSEITFTITPPFWQTTWFIVFAILVAIAVVFIIIRFIAKRKYEKQLFLFENERNLSLERTRIADEMHDDVGADLSNLLLKIRMDEIKFAEKGAVDLIGLRQATSNIIKKMDEIIWSLNAQRDTLEGLVNFIAKYHQEVINSNVITGKLKMPSQIADVSIGAELKRDIFLTVKELLNNALKHASASEIDLLIDITDKEFYLMIKDNGVGFNQEKIYTGNGLKNIQKRTLKNRGSISIKSSENSGTIINLTFPLF